MNALPAVAVFGSSATRPGTEAWTEAEQVGSRLAQAGLAVVTGGYGGTMEAVSKGAAQSGGHVIGVTAAPLFPDRVGANPHVVQEIAAGSLAERIGHLVGLSQGCVALPGSIGTAAELVIAWNLNHVARHAGGLRYPTVAVGETWKRLARLLSEEAGAFAGDVHLAEDADTAVDWLLEQAEIRAQLGDSF